MGPYETEVEAAVVLFEVVEGIRCKFGGWEAVFSSKNAQTHEEQLRELVLEVHCRQDNCNTSEKDWCMHDDTCDHAFGS